MDINTPSFPELPEGFDDCSGAGSCAGFSVSRAEVGGGDVTAGSVSGGGGTIGCAGALIDGVSAMSSIIKLAGLFPTVLKLPAIIITSAAPMCRTRESARAHCIQRFLEFLAGLEVLVIVASDDVMNSGVVSVVEAEGNYLK